MASNLACVGLAADTNEEFARMLDRMEPAMTSVGRDGPLEAFRWQDQSGARVVITVRSGSVEGFMPSFAGTAVTQLGGVRRISNDVSNAGVFDDHGEQLTALTLELEQRALLAQLVVSGPARLVALAADVAVHATEEDFARSPASLLDPNADQSSEPPPHFVANGWPWPPRLGAASFISFGAFEPGEGATAHARLNGVVKHADRRVNQLTGQEFVVARVASVFDADVCLAVDEHRDVPPVGSVIGGTVFMVGSLDAWKVDQRLAQSSQAATGRGGRLGSLLGVRKPH